MYPAYMPTSKQRGTNERLIDVGLDYLPLMVILAKNTATSPCGEEKDKETKKGTRFKFLPHQDASVAAKLGSRVVQVPPAAAVHERARHVRPVVDALRRKVEVTNKCFIGCASAR